MGKQNFNYKNRILRLFLSVLLGMGLLLSGIAFGAAPQKASRPVKAVNNNEGAIIDERSERIIAPDLILRNKIEHSKTRDRDLPIPGWNVTSFGGISYSPPDDRYWFKINGALRIDQTFFPKRNLVILGQRLPASSGHLRKLGVGLDGGIGENLEYTVSLAYGLTATGSQILLEDTWLAYDGFSDYNEVFIGPVVPGYYYGLDNADNTSWLPFLERSLIADAFYPGDGAGVMTDFFGEHFGLTLVASTEDVNNIVPEVRRHQNRFRAIGRLTVAPVHECGDVWHIGVSGQFRSKDNDLFSSGFSERASARTRRTIPFLATGPLDAKDAVGYSVEFARLWGPLLLEAEYQGMHVNRMPNRLIVNPALRNDKALQFYGWMVEGRFLLTGGSHSYDVRDGGFGSIPATDFTPYGAWEVTARYDMINLNSRDIAGGKQYDASVGLHWYINELVKFSANYIHATVYPSRILTPDQKRQDVNIVGLRLQVRFK